MKSQVYDIDNSRPDDPNYPTAEPSDMHEDITVKEGQYVVDRDGDIVIVTSGNDKYIGNTFVDELNYGYCRARFMGCRDDFLGFTNQLRLATKEEIIKAKAYKPVIGPKVTNTGQVVLL